LKSWVNNWYSLSYSPVDYCIQLWDTHILQTLVNFFGVLSTFRLLICLYFYLNCLKLIFLGGWLSLITCLPWISLILSKYCLASTSRFTCTILMDDRRLLFEYFMLSNSVTRRWFFYNFDMSLTLCLHLRYNFGWWQRASSIALSLLLGSTILMKSVWLVIISIQMAIVDCDFRRTGASIIVHLIVYLFYL